MYCRRYLFEIDTEFFELSCGSSSMANVSASCCFLVYNLIEVLLATPVAWAWVTRLDGVYALPGQFVFDEEERSNRVFSSSLELRGQL